MTIDLHIHSTASDGTLTPLDILKLSSKLGLKTISITDHDTIEGSKLAMHYSHKYNINIIPGVEINSYYQGEEIHLLGYYIDILDKNLNKILASLQISRIKRIDKIISKLQNLNFNITMDDVLKIADNSAPGRPHIARVLVNKGLAPSIKYVFENYLGVGKPAYVDRLKLTPKEAIRMIKKSKGLPVLAHPGIIKNKTIIPKVISFGVMGIEVFHPEHTMEQTNFYLKYAKNKGLFITGGSDCHGPFQDRPPLLGTITLKQNYLQDIKNWYYEKNQ